MNLVQMAIDQLLSYIVDGSLPSCYSGVDQWLFDFYPGLSWTDTITDIEGVLAHPDFPKIDYWFMMRYGFDFEKELKNAVVDLRRRTAKNDW